MGRGIFVPPAGREMFGTLGDSAPDQWGRRLMRRAERRRAEKELRAPRTLFETDFLLGVADETRLGAFRFRYPGDAGFLSSTESGVPKLVELGKLFQFAIILILIFSPTQRWTGEHQGSLPDASSLVRPEQ